MKVKILREGAKMPTRGTKVSAGLDLYALIENDLEIWPGETVKVPTGVAIALPNNTAGLIFARSGLAVKEGLAPANCVGVIDEDYRGEIIVALHNHSKTSSIIKNHDRIAQLVITPVLYEEVEEAESLSETERGEGGFGSTGR